MKKFFILFLIIFLTFPSLASAMSIGGAETQGRGKFGVGLDSEFVLKREFRERNFINALPQNVTYKNEIEAYNTLRETLKISYGIIDNLDIYVKVGLETEPTYRENIDAFFVGAAAIHGISKLRGKNALVYGLGLKGTYPLPYDWLIGCDTQYFRYSTRYRSSGGYDTAGAITGNVVLGTITYSEWHIAPYIAKKFGNFTPYIGAKYSQSELRDKIDSQGDIIVFAQGAKYYSLYNVGAFGGLDVNLGEHWRLNLEGRFIDETAASLGVNYKF